jgi:8-amino-7-oxononanoate synthase
MLELNTLLNKWKTQELLRVLRETELAQAPVISIGGRSCLLFSSNNYLGIANHPSLKKAANEATERFGTGAGASRLISGNHPLFSLLEGRLARFKRTEASLVFNSGYTTNLSVLPALVGKEDVVLADRCSHASLIDGCRLSGARLRIIRHNDLDQLEKLLKKRPKRGKLFIITEGVFSMEGDIAPLDRINTFAENYDAFIYLDDAHATGVLGPGGRGTIEHFGLNPRSRIIQMGTFSKALGSFGGYIAGSETLVRYLVQRARGFIYSTALPPSVVAANIAALDLVDQEPGLGKRLWSHRDHLHEGFSVLGLNTMQSQTPILPILIGDVTKAVRFSDRLLEEGIYIPAIRPPTIPKGTSRLRISLMATHTVDHIKFLLSKIESVAKELGILC